MTAARAFDASCATRRSPARFAVAKTSPVCMTHSPTACAGSASVEVSARAASDRTRPASSMARTSQHGAGTHSATRCTSVSATRSGSRLELTARIISASTSARPSLRRSAACSGRSLSARSVRNTGTLALPGRRRARVCRALPVTRLCVPCGMANPSKSFCTEQIYHIRTTRAGFFTYRTIADGGLGGGIAEVQALGVRRSGVGGSGSRVQDSGSGARPPIPAPTAERLIPEPARGPHAHWPPPAASGIIKVSHPSTRQMIMRPAAQ